MTVHVIIKPFVIQVCRVAFVSIADSDPEK